MGKLSRSILERGQSVTLLCRSAPPSTTRPRSILERGQRCHPYSVACLQRGIVVAIDLGAGNRVSQCGLVFSGCQAAKSRSILERGQSVTKETFDERILYRASRSLLERGQSVTDIMWCRDSSGHNTALVERAGLDSMGAIDLEVETQCSRCLAAPTKE